ncbi:hypothetical protein HGRIS_014531 [Hohenbuehelia grisea]|uniref:Uncharacterized protein n=1 Tax=Hohenbuehelia grisea TaxID=104357 RepID=A0ABR3JVP9_9AGAR
MTLHTEDFDNSMTTRGLALREICHTLWYTPDFRYLVDRILAQKGIGSSAEERAIYATSSFNLTPVQVGGDSNPRGSVWQLTGEPICDDPEDHKALLSIVRRCTYLIQEMHLLEVKRLFNPCEWCKSEMHPYQTCPVPHVDNWLGPETDNDMIAAAVGNGGTRPNRGRGGQARGNWNGRSRGTTRGRGSTRGGARGNTRGRGRARGF